MKVLTARSFRYRFGRVAELPEFPVFVARLQRTYIRSRQVWKRCTRNRVFVALACRTYRSSGYGRKCPTDRTKVPRPQQINYLLFVRQANTLWKTCANICLGANTFLRTCANICLQAKSRLRTCANICLAGKYSLENLRKYLSGRQILPWRTCASSMVFFVMTTIMEKQLLLQGGRRERLAVSYVMRWEIGVGNTKANPWSVHLEYLLIGVEKHRISQTERKWKSIHYLWVNGLFAAANTPGSTAVFMHYVCTP